MTEGNGKVRELPKGWALTTVKETIKIIDYRGRTPPYSENGIPHLRSSNIRNRKIVWENLRYVSEETYQAYMTRGLPEKGDVLFTTEAPLGEVALAPEQRFSLAQRMMILRPNKDLLSSKFLLYQIENEEFQRNLSKSGTGTTVTGVSSRNFQPTPIILVTINEQNRIVEKIEELFSELDQGIKSLKTAQKQLKVYRQAVLKWAFEGKLTEEWRRQHQSTLKTGEALLAQIKAERENRYQQQLAEWEMAVREWEAIGKVGKKPTKPQKQEYYPVLDENQINSLEALPDSWIWEKSGNICQSIVPNRDKPKSFTGSIPWITTPDIEPDNITINPRSIYIGLTLGEVEKYNARLIPINSVVMTCVGSFGMVFTTSYECIINQQLHAFITHKYINPKFLAYALKRQKHWMEDHATSTTIAYLNKTNCNSTPIPICCIEEQEQIVQEIESRLSICDQLEATIIENLQKAEALRQSILKQAFEGKLVPQDPNDEPAETLLERIKAEQQVNGNTGKKSNPSHQQLTLQEL